MGVRIFSRVDAQTVRVSEDKPAQDVTTELAAAVDSLTERLRQLIENRDVNLPADIAETQRQLDAAILQHKAIDA